MCHIQIPENSDSNQICVNCSPTSTTGYEFFTGYIESLADQLYVPIPTGAFIYDKEKKIYCAEIELPFEPVWP